MATVPIPVRRRRAARGAGEQLRAEIIAAAKDLLARTGNTEDVSIRAVADLVRVTSPSIYLHFADKDELISAAVADVFAELDQAMLERAGTVEAPMDRILAFGMAYVAFALDHPEQYRVATMSPHAKTKSVDAVMASSAFTHFHTAVLQCVQAGIFAGADPLQITYGLWACAHGIASLVIAKPNLPWGDIEELTMRTLCSAGMGQALIDRVGELPPDADWLAKMRPST